MNYTKVLIILYIFFILSGCASLKTYHNETKLGDTHRSIAVDAKQRFIFTGPVTVGDDPGNLSPDNKQIICAEPSPDVFSAFAASIEGSASSEAISAALKGAFSENAATIGIRTQTIQLLRDSMYRICEGFLSGAIDKKQFHQLHQRFQRIMVTLVAIDQLTQAAQPPATAISTDAAITNTMNLNELQKNYEVAGKALVNAENNVKALEADLDGVDCDTAPDGSEDKKNCNSLETAKESAKEANETYEKQKELLDKARDSINLSASGEVRFVHTHNTPSLSDGAIETLSSSIFNMVRQAYSVNADTLFEQYGDICVPDSLLKRRDNLINQLASHVYDDLDKRANLARNLNDSENKANVKSWVENLILEDQQPLSENRVNAIFTRIKTEYYPEDSGLITDSIDNNSQLVIKNKIRSINETQAIIDQTNQFCGVILNKLQAHSL